MLRRLGPVLALGLLCACDPHDTRVTDKNKDSILEEMRQSPKIGYDEKTLLQALSERQRDRSALVGKTVRELIAEQRAFAEREKAAVAEQARQVEEEQRKRAEQAARVKGAVVWTLADKRYVAKDPAAERYEDQIEIRCTYENRSGKDIESLSGRLLFKDSAGQTFFTAQVKGGKALGAGAKEEWVAHKPFDQFSDSDSKLRDASLKGLTVEWVPAKIRFADGSEL